MRLTMLPEQLSDDEKAPYVELANKDKERYAKAKAVYEANKSEAAAYGKQLVISKAVVFASSLLNIS